MKAPIVLLMSLFSLSAFANEQYQCHNVREGNTDPAVSLKIATGTLTNKITSVDLVSKVRGRKFQATENPFTSVDASYEDLDPNAVTEASTQEFKVLSKKEGRSTTSISLSDSLMTFQQSGYAYYYEYSCFWILDCFTTTHYYRCEKI